MEYFDSSSIIDMILHLDGLLFSVRLSKHAITYFLNRSFLEKANSCNYSIFCKISTNCSLYSLFSLAPYFTTFQNRSQTSGGKFWKTPNGPLTIFFGTQTKNFDETLWYTLMHKIFRYHKLSGTPEKFSLLVCAVHFEYRMYVRKLSDNQVLGQ